MEILCRPVDAAERQRRDIRADQHQVGVKLLHDVELALGAVEGPGALLIRNALELAERLEQGDRQTAMAHQAADSSRDAVEGLALLLQNLQRTQTAIGTTPLMAGGE